ncbi:MAG: C39 family peptidase [Verrucomicrobiota bacterium]
MRKLFLLGLTWPAIILAGPPVAVAPVAMDSVLDAKGAVWLLPADDFMTAHRALGFQWTSANKETARAARQGLSWQGMPVYEAMVRFDKGTPKEISIQLFNRGDAGDLDEPTFQKLTQAADEKLTAWAGSKGVLLKNQERTASATIRRKSWIKEPYRVDLVWSYSEKSRSQGIAAALPEYARLQITPFDPAQDPRKTILATGTASQPKPVSALELKSRVKRSPTGDVVIPTVPMVDQGLKGYCAAAVAERVLRYYGRNLDQHEIAQLARTSASGGTNPDQMVAALRRIGDETKMDVAALQDFDIREFEKTVADYNRAAKHGKKPSVQFMHQSGNTIIVESPVTVFQAMDTDLLREARLKRDGSLQEFKQTITKYINNGAPLAWGCIVGKVPEKPEMKGFGGHMRLIIGYNDQTREVLYSDTWGAGHELKRLSLSDAWTITLGLYCFQPRDVRF